MLLAVFISWLRQLPDANPLYRGCEFIFDLDAPAAQARSGRATAALPIALRAAPGGGLELALPAGKSGSRIEVSTDLRTWAPWTPADPSRPLHVDVDAGSPAAFFRLARD